MSEPLDNPRTVVWSHSDRRADFFELPTDGGEMNQALTWLLRYYDEIKLWMGVETEEGAELFPNLIKAVVEPPVFVPMGWITGQDKALD